MRLSRLKLTGFKSFADPSTLNFRANRTAVVGPNGCGKSNVIDAIRWVMGESSARQLRGGNIQDVIFTGTSRRKAVGMASVELHFDNTYGKLGGEYNAYTELSVRRQVNRDGRSEYFLNGTRCRRRDITDIFLGTGLGPRSYAIIEQGMISRLVEARPEEMRVFIEEAAGVSKYQARRRETLQHIAHTEQNLARLQDIAHSLKAQLKTLKRQSEASIHYHALQSQIKTLKVEIISFQAGQALQLQQQYTVQMTELGEIFKQTRSELNQIEQDLEASHTLFQRLIERSTPLQVEWQQAEKKLTQAKAIFEQKQQFFKQSECLRAELENQQQQSFAKLNADQLQLEQLYKQAGDDQVQVEQLEQDLQRLKTSEQDLAGQYQQAKQQFHALKQQREQQQQLKKELLVQLEQLDKSTQRMRLQKQRLEDQRTQLERSLKDNPIKLLQEEQQKLILDSNQRNALILQTNQELIDIKQQLDQFQSQTQQQKNQLQILKAEQKNLNQLLAKQSQQSEHERTLISVLQLTEAGKAHVHLIEKLFSSWLEASYLELEHTFQAKIARQIKAVNLTQSAMLFELEPLSGWIKSPSLSLWQNIWLGNDLTQAMALQKQLSISQSIVTRDGYHVARDWVIALDYDQNSQHQGSLSHRLRLDEIKEQLATRLAELEHTENELGKCQQDYEVLQATRQQLKKEQDSLQTKRQQTELEIAKYESAEQAYAKQQQQLALQLEQLNAELEEDAMQRDDLDIDLHALNLKLEESMPVYSSEQLKLEALALELSKLEQQSKAYETEAKQLERALQITTQKIQLLKKDISFAQMQDHQLLAQLKQTQQALEPIQLELPSLETQFLAQLTVTEKLKKSWDEWQEQINQVQKQQQQLTEQRFNTQQQDEQIREQLEQKRLSWHQAKSDAEHLNAQLKELDATLVEGLTISLEQHQQALQKAQQQFEKLGAVNLAAADEYHEVSHQFDQLNHQIQDLENTISQLKEAMKSIDQETKKLFMTTFDQINQELQELFPKVFNGGEARLSLEDDWQSGVKLMARPPGKHNSSLALLSGGEKTLTALSLVFAIFRLNPAPFCVLDEVDAPLDDANVQRFCNLVKELSEQVQFIYITHNKLAMTMATDLLGVTMPEPGSSKLVSVNLEEAKEYGLVTES